MGWRAAAVQEAVAAALTACAWAAVDSVAGAQDAFAGRWNAGPTQIRAQVQSWGPDCGRQPVSAMLPAQGAVQVDQTGDHLAIQTDPPRWTHACWSENRATRALSATVDPGLWRTICATPSNDPRAETGTYTINARESGRILVTEVSRYNWQLNESRCNATITTTLSLSRVVPTVTPSTAPTPACVPGPVARLALSPMRLRLQPGERGCFRVQAFDAAGCPVLNVAVTWTLEAPPARSATLQDGCLHAADSAAAGEGNYRVLAFAGAVRAEASAVVRPADLSDLIAERAASPDAQVALGDAPRDAIAPSVSVVGTPTVAVTTTSARPPWRLILGGLAALAMVVVTAWGFARRRRASRVGIAANAATTRAGDPFAATMPALEQPSVPTAAAANPVALAQLVCPRCRRGYPPDVRVCSADGAALVAYDAFVAEQRRQTQAPELRKRCPTCGELFAAEVVFCGKDGARLIAE